MMPRDRSYSSTIDERSPLLRYQPSVNRDNDKAIDHHNQFCSLVGVTPHTLPPGQSHTPHPQSLYCRAKQRRRNQSYVYAFTATLTNGLLLSQVVLGAALTGLGASDSSRVLITIFGALNTVIAGVIAFLKSRGQPLRARMFRDDLDRVVDEIESSAVMWLGISSGVHGYDAIDTDELVTVRSEVARLTRLYDRAVKANTANDPDLYAADGQGDFHHAALRSRGAGPPMPPVAPPQIADAPIQAPVIQPPVAVEPDESPATKAPTPPPADLPKPAENPQPAPETNGDIPNASEQLPTTDTPAEDPKPTSNDSTSSPKPVQTEQSTINGDKSVPNSTPTTPAVEQPDPDASPATAARLPPRDESKSEKNLDKLAKLSRLEDLRRSGSDAQAMSPFFNV